MEDFFDEVRWISLNGYIPWMPWWHNFVVYPAAVVLYYALRVYFKVRSKVRGWLEE